MTSRRLAMRRLGSFALFVCAISCAHEERRAVTVQTPEMRSSAPQSPALPPQYLVADPGGRVTTSSAVALGPTTFGITVDKARVVIGGRGEPRVAVEETEQALHLALRIPSRFGGGFLFTTEHMIYRAEGFETALRPIARVPETIQDVSFLPKGILVRTKNGERWALGLGAGERIAIEPLGAADVEALDDGRALAFSDQGTVFASTDHGAHWSDVTASVRSSPTGVRQLGGELWLLESSGGALRLETDGRMSAFDKPPDEKPLEIRTKDPRWHGRDTPLRTAFHSGAAIDESTALILEGGDLVRVDVHTGDVLQVLPGRAPPDAQCDAVASGGDVLFACNARGGGAMYVPGQGAAFVVSHTTSGDNPTVEQSFAAGGQFYASDDGGLAFAGPCGPVSPNGSPELTVCVRQPGGSWEEHDLSSMSADAGSGVDPRVVRWIPRADGRVVAIVSEPAWAIVDPRSGVSTPLPPEARDVIERSGLPPNVHFYKRRYVRMGDSSIDATWSASPTGGYRGWIKPGGSVELSEDGRITRSAYQFESIVGGAFALGRTKEGRVFQTTDHGASWVEVAGPPGATGMELRGCTTAGCDLGAFYRVGWAARPPRPEPEPTKAAVPPDVRRAPRLELSCRPQGAASSRGINTTSGDGADLGLGASRVAVVPDGSDWAMIRNVVARTIVSPLRDPPSGGDSDTSLVRALFTGYQASREGDAIVIMGPNKNVSAARRTITYVPGFDPSGRIGRTSFGLAEVFAAGRAVGLGIDDLAEDMADSGMGILVTPSDPTAVSDVAYNNERGLVIAVRSDRTRVVIRQPQNDNRVLSAVALEKDETAFLEVESSGILHVFKIGPRGTSDLFDLNATSNDAAYAPANPDALAVNARGELAVLRTPSGSDPASAVDPAYVVSPAANATALAPWSELRFADDPACKSDTTGWRATLQVIAPWIAVSTPELRVDPGPMVARVKWSPSRVCLEGFEVRAPNAQIRVGTEVKSVATWLVAKGSTFARVGIGEGVEWRQALECTIKK